MDAIDETIQKHIEGHGWGVIKVMEDQTGPGFAYTVGLYHNYQHPEILIIGLDLQTMHLILNIIGDEIKKGKRYDAGQEYDEILEGYNCAFQVIERDNYRDYLGCAISHYQPNSFPALQCVYPDMDGGYPWNPNSDSEFHELQPVLTSSPVIV